MSDAYWRYNDSRQPPAASLLAKRPRSDYDLPSGRDMAGYYSRDDDRLTLHGVRDAESINQSYERYLRSGQVYPGADSSRLLGSGLPSHAVDDPRIGSDPRISSDLRLESDPRISSDPRMTSVRIMDPGMSVKGQVSNLGSGRSEVSLPPDASSTLFVEGLPANCTRREVAHIFRPFVGYKEVRLVTKEARRSRGDPLVLCFVDFLSPPHAATAMDALQVVPALFQHSLKETEEERVTSLDHVFTVEPMKLTSPSTDTEVALALRVLEGCCLIHRQSTILAHQNKAIPVLMNILSSRGVLEQGACLDALIALMLDSTANQMDFETCNGIEEVAAIIRDKQVDENLRMKCGEFLLLLIGHVDARDMQPMATVHDDIRRLLGEKSASLIWAASQFGSTLDPEERMTALHIQARRVLESLDLFGV